MFVDKLDTQLDALIDIGGHSDKGMLIISIDDLSTVYFNERASILFDLRKLRRPTITDLLSNVIHDDRALVQDMINRSLGSDQLNRFNFRLRGRNSEDERFLSWTGYKILSKRYLVALLEDITEIRQHETYLVEFGAKKNTLLDALRHNLGGALRLSRNLSLTARGQLQQGNRDVTRWLELIDENTNHCLDIINDLLNDEHIKSPGIFVKKIRVDVVALCRYIIEELSNSYDNGIFLLDAVSERIYINTDEVKLMQIINNFTANAIKFSLPDDPIVVSITNDDGIMISVEDHGIGIPGELQPYIYERESRAMRVGLNGEPSSGVGLYVSRKLADLIGARISFRTTVGKGSVFTLMFTC